MNNHAHHSVGFFMEDHMITFKSRNDLVKLNNHDPAYPVMEELVRVLIDDFTEPGQPYDADDYGYLVLIEPGDVDCVLTELDMQWTLTEVPWEGASMRNGFYYAVYLGTDDYGMGFVIPNADWINSRLRETLDGILDQPYALTTSTNPEEIHHEDTET